MNDVEKMREACKGIYMCYHVSMIGNEMMCIQNAWNLGQKFYNMDKSNPIPTVPQKANKQE